MTVMRINKLLLFYLLFGTSLSYILNPINEVYFTVLLLVTQLFLSIFVFREINNQSCIESRTQRATFLFMMYVFPVFGCFIFLKSITKQKIKIKTDLLKSFILYLFILGAFNNFSPKSVSINVFRMSLPPTIEFIYRTTKKNKMIANQTVKELSSCKKNFSCEIDLISTLVVINQLSNFEVIPLFGMHFIYSLINSKSQGASKEFTSLNFKKLLNFYSGLISKKSRHPISSIIIGLNPISSLEVNLLVLVKKTLNHNLINKFERKKDNFIDAY